MNIFSDGEIKLCRLVVDAERGKSMPELRAGIEGVFSGNESLALRALDALSNYCGRDQTLFLELYFASGADNEIGLGEIGARAFSSSLSALRDIDKQPDAQVLSELKTLYAGVENCKSASLRLGVLSLILMAMYRKQLIAQDPDFADSLLGIAEAADGDQEGWAPPALANLLNKG